MSHSSLPISGTISTRFTRVFHKEGTIMQLATIKQQVRFTRALFFPAFALLWTGQTVSSLGDGVFTTALAWEILIKTGSASAMSLVVIARYIPMILFFLIGGVS